MLQALSDMPALQAAFTPFSPMRRYYFFLPEGEGIAWYMGTEPHAVQGPYTAWNGDVNETYFSWLAAGVSRTPRAAAQDNYIVSGGLYGDAPGLFVLQRGASPGGLFTLVSQTPITPAGTDARWPMLYTDPGQDVTVFYTVDGDHGRDIYAVPIHGGESVLIVTVEVEPDIRPIGALDTEDGTALLLQEFATGVVRVVYLGGDKAVDAGALDISAREGRFFVFFDRMRFFHETSRGMTAGDFDPAWIPANPHANN
jgi:hypothetical protein